MSKTTEEKITELASKQARERAELDLELTVATVIPPDRRWIHVRSGKNVDEIALVKYGDDFADENALPWSRAVELVELLPAVDALLCKGTFTGFHSRNHVKGRSVPRPEEEHDISPILLNVKCTHGPGEMRRPRVSLSWWTETAAGRLKIQCEMGHPPPGVLVCVRRPKTGHEYRSDSPYARQGFSWTKSSTYEVHPTNAMRRIRDPRIADEEAATAAASLERVRWWHDSTHPGQQTFYWTNVGGPYEAAKMASWIVRQLAAAASAPVNE